MPETGNIFVDKYGPPERWTCPDCGHQIDLYPALPFEGHICNHKFRHPPKRVYYVMVADSDSGKLFFAVTGEGDPNQSVEVKVGNDLVKLEKRTKGDFIVWRIPPEYDPIWGIDWRYDKRLQIGERMPENVQRQYAAQNRHSA